MAIELPSPAGKQPDLRAPLTPAKVTDILWDSAVEAVVLALLASIMGGVVVGIIGGLWRDMAPSLPPGLAGKPSLEAEPSVAWTGVSSWFQQHRFAILFGVIFAAKAAARLIRFSHNEAHRNAAAWARRVGRRLSTQWFGLVVANAFTAFGLTLALQFSQAFSLTQLLWHLLANWFTPVIHALAAFIPGAGLLGGLVDWYNSNQLKFTFWLLYSAAICDDLGLPNYKALARWAWRRFVRAYHPANLEGAGS